MKVTVISENTVGVPMPRGLVGEHGLSFLIEGESITLFDTGQGGALLNNLRAYGKDVNSIDRVILSHGHYDHVGGLSFLLDEREGELPVYVSEEAFRKKLAVIELPDNRIEIPIGFPMEKAVYQDKGAGFNYVKDLTEIDVEISSISDIERPADWKAWDVRLKVKDGDMIIDDPFNDDLSLLLQTGSGPVVLLGCAHAGIIEILNDLSNKTGLKEFHAVIGGTHLESASENYLNQTIEVLKKYNVKVVGTSHCTGFKAACSIASSMGDAFKVASVGSVFEF